MSRIAKNRKQISLRMKRLFDLLFSIAGVILFFPIFLVISIVIKIFLGSPVFFFQQRPGYKGRPFCLLKFRTMAEIRGTDGNLLPDEKRLTPLGIFLRKTSLDELPQLFNVILGDLSLVGPRPLLMEYLPLYSKDQFRRHEVMPGITGWAQINGRNAINWEQKFEYDLWYVDNWDFWLDLKIIYFTLEKVFKGEGVRQSGHATVTKFTGYSS